jgi:hypothetical protein
MDFDEASCEWRKNKIYLGNGYFRYKCLVKNCNEITYSYTTEHKDFVLFATDFDLKYKNHINKYKYCEEHILIEDNDLSNTS